MFEGVYTAMITPFSGGAIDRPALEELIERQVKAGVAGLVPCGTTGESATMSDDEIMEVVRITVQVAAGRCQVIAGVGSNDTARTTQLARRAQKAGVDGLLVITPYYNKPTQAGLYAHFSAVAAAVPTASIMLYNVPGRTGVSMTVETIERLAEKQNIVALKEATGDMAFAARIHLACGNRLAILSGDDITALPQWAIGARGVVSVTSNLLPERMVQMWTHFATNEVHDARRIHGHLLPLFDGLFLEANPGPVKTLVAQKTGLCSPDLRLPLVPIEKDTLDALESICRRLEIETLP
jgi:4-hydroxy-tetrahydrodipicolinate synthase